MAACYGLTEICRTVGGKTVVISEADSTVGLLAVRGLNVIGTTRDANRREWLQLQFGLDDIINVMDEDATDHIGDELKAKVLGGIDYYIFCSH